MIKRSVPFLFVFCLIICLFIPIFSFSLSANAYEYNYQFFSLPSDYKQVEYLEVTGSQSINLGQIYNDAFSFVVNIDKKSSSSNPSGTIFGSYRAGLYLTLDLSSNSTNLRTGSYNSSYTSGVSSLTNIAFSCQDHYQDLRINGSVVKSTSNFVSLSGFDSFLFSQPIASSPSSLNNARFYDALIYHGVALTHHYIPCYRVSDHKGGVYDVVTSIFYPNIGSQEFTFGPDAQPPYVPAPSVSLDRFSFSFENDIATSFSIEYGASDLDPLTRIDNVSSPIDLSTLFQYGGILRLYGHAPDYISTYSQWVFNPLSTPSCSLSGNVLTVSYPTSENVSIQVLKDGVNYSVLNSPGSLTLTDTGYYTAYAFIDTMNPDGTFYYPSYSVSGVYFTSPLTPLEAPIVSSSSGVISWNPVVHALSYVYEVYSDSELSQLLGSFTTSSTSIEVSGGGFYVRVKALASGYSDSAWSNVVLSYVNPPSPPALTQLDTPLVSADHLSVSWLPVENASSYTVQVFSDSSLINLLSYEIITPTSYDVGAAGLFVRVKAVADGYLDSAWSSVVSTYLDPPDPLSTPELFYQNGILTWSTPDLSRNPLYVVVYGENTPVYSGSASSYVPSLSGTYRVYSYLSGVTSSMSNSVSVTVSQGDGEAYLRGYQQGQKDIEGLKEVINAGWTGFVDVFDQFTEKTSIGGITLISILVSIVIIAAVFFLIKLIAKG